MLHPLPLPLSSCLGCIPPLIGLPSLRFYAVGSSLFLLSVCFCLCSLFYRDDVLCWLLLARPFLYAFHAHLRFPVDLVWFRLSCDHGWIRSGSVNVRKQQKNNNNPDAVLLVVRGAPPGSRGCASRSSTSGSKAPTGVLPTPAPSAMHAHAGGRATFSVLVCFRRRQQNLDRVRTCSVVDVNLNISKTESQAVPRQTEFRMH